MEKNFSAGLSIIILILIMLSLVAGCAGEKTTRLGEEFTLAPGQSNSIKGEGLKVRFVEVTGDSRCARGVECIQAGDVKCLIDITYLDSDYRLELIQLGMSENAAIDFQGYRLSFDVQPYPEEGKTIKPDEYRLVLTVNKI